ncbi:MAG: Cof-type HAD-IIB family hydrolase [Candidatus Krumholzibacteriia bacterium]
MSSPAADAPDGRSRAGPPRIGLLIADVDGTLLTPDKVLTGRAGRAVRKLHDAGIAFAVTSGRPPRGMSMLIGPLALTTPLPGFNGGMFVHPDLTIIEQHVLPADVTARAIGTIGAHGLTVWIYRGEDWFVPDRESPHVAREEATVRFPPTVVPGFERLLDNVVKIVGVSDDLEAVARCEAAAHRAFARQVSAARSQSYYLDVTHPNANKGAVVDWLSERLQIPADRIATIGDQPNDVLMFARSGLSIAMGNAGEEVRQEATRVTTSNAEEGFANAVERFILPDACRAAP